SPLVKSGAEAFVAAAPLEVVESHPLAKFPALYGVHDVAQYATGAQSGNAGSSAANAVDVIDRGSEAEALSPATSAPAPTNGPLAKIAAAEARLTEQSNEVAALGERIASAKSPPTDADRAAWAEGHAKLREGTAALAAAVSELPSDAPEREAAAKELTRL